MDYRNISTERQFKACTGYGKDDFKKLCAGVSEYYISLHGESYESYIREYMENCGNVPPKFLNLEDALFFVLYQCKVGLTWDALGAPFGMCGSAALKNYDKFLGLLEGYLEKKSHAETRVHRSGGV